LNNYKMKQANKKSDFEEKGDPGYRGRGRTIKKMLLFKYSFRKKVETND